MTYRLAMAWAARQGIDPMDARWLMEQASGLSARDYLLNRERTMEPEAVARFEAMVRRRAAGEPVQRILGYWAFGELTLRVDGRALIPRPETELLVEEALRHIPEGETVAVADVGCGTGCIGLSVKSARLRAQVTLLDISEGARELAAENAALHRLNVRILAADMRRPLPGGPYGVICSNPPYIPRQQCRELEDEVRNYDPILALDGGEDGLDYYRALAARAEDSLLPGGVMVLELGAGQAAAVTELFTPVGTVAPPIPDLAGIDRILTVRKRK